MQMKCIILFVYHHDVVKRKTCIIMYTCRSIVYDSGVVGMSVGVPLLQAVMECGEWKDLVTQLETSKQQATTDKEGTHSALNSLHSKISQSKTCTMYSPSIPASIPALSQSFIPNFYVYIPTFLYIS